MKKTIVLFSLLIAFTISVFFTTHKKQEAKVYDCFMVLNEFDLLEIRLNELWDVVDYFVIVENPLTHSGKPKPLYFQENKQRFSKYSDKIIHVIGPAHSELTNVWDRDGAQRNDTLLGLKNAKDNDIIMFSDLDEIIRAKSVAQIKKVLSEKQSRNKRICKYVRIEQDNYRYYLNRVYYKEPLWARAMATTYKQVKKKSPRTLRENIYNDWFSIKNGGWHFSCLGNVEQNRYKIEACCHQELNNEACKSEKYMLDIINKSKQVQIDETFPKVIVDNIDYYKKIRFIEED